MTEVRIPSVVALLHDLPEKGLLRGQVGTVVDGLAPGVFEVEFCDNDGRTYARIGSRDNALASRAGSRGRLEGRTAVRASG
jgi:hypothetical protein